MNVLDKVESIFLQSRWIDAIPEAIVAAISGPMGCGGTHQQPQIAAAPPPPSTAGSPTFSSPASSSVPPPPTGEEMNGYGPSLEEICRSFVERFRNGPSARTMNATALAKLKQSCRIFCDGNHGSYDARQCECAERSDVNTQKNFQECLQEPHGTPRGWEGINQL